MDNKLHAYDFAFMLVVSMLAMLHYFAWSAYPPDVDPTNFTVALSNSFSPTFDSPHPPGYPLYVFAARLAASLVGSNHAYQLINLGMLLGSGGALYWLFRRFNAVAIGFASSVLVMTHPLAWAATVIAESYVTDLFFGCAILAFVLTQRDSRDRMLTGAFVLFLLLGLVRPVSGAMLLPLAMAASYATTRSKSLPLFVAIAGIGAVILAYGITVYVSGGLDVYRAATDRVMGEAFRESSILAGASLSAHFLMLQRLFGWLLFFSLPMLLGILIVASTRRSELQFKQHSSALMIGGAWLLPPLAFYSVIYYLKPTHQLIYIPCLLIPIAWILFGKDSILNRLGAKLILAGLVIVQLGIFFVPIPHLPQPLFRLTHAYFIQQDQAWEKLLSELDVLPKQNTLLIWAAHPSLRMFTTRLLNREGLVAAVNPSQTGLDYFDPKKGRWLPRSTSDGMIPNNYSGVVIVDALAGKPVVQYVPLTDRRNRRLAHLLKHVRQAAFHQSSGNTET